MIVVGLKINARKSIREAEAEIKDHRTFVGTDDENDELVSEADLAMERERVSWSLSAQYQDKMISTLKRLHTASKRPGDPTHISLISAIIAYEKCKAFSEKKSIPSIGLVLGYGVLKYNKDGSWGAPISQNDTFRDVFNWLEGNDPDDPLFKNAMELVRMCEELGIKLANEDPYDYGEEFISSLISTHITENRDYFITEGSSINRENLERLRKISMDEYNVLERNLAAARSVEDKLSAMVLDFNSLRNSEVVNTRQNREFESDNFIRLYSAHVDKSVKLDDFITEDGVYKFRNSAPYLFDVSRITTKPALHGAQALLHYSGYLILRIHSQEMWVLPVTEAIIYLADQVGGKIKPGQAYANQKTFGAWVKV
jgi:hypothetical protein